MKGVGPDLPSLVPGTTPLSRLGHCASLFVSMSCHKRKNGRGCTALRTWQMDHPRTGLPCCAPHCWCIQGPRELALATCYQACEWSSRSSPWVAARHGSGYLLAGTWRRSCPGSSSHSEHRSPGAALREGMSGGRLALGSAPRRSRGNLTADGAPLLHCHQAHLSSLVLSF